MRIAAWLLGLLIPLAYAAPVGPVQYAALPACLDTGGNHLNYNSSTGALICGNSGSSSTSISPGTSGNITTSPNPITGTGTVDIVNNPTFNNSSTAAPAAPGANVVQVHVAGNTGNLSTVLIDSFGQQTMFAGRRADGVPGTPTTLVVNETINGFGSFGYDGTAYSTVMGRWETQADENWTTGAHGTRWRLMGTPTGSTTIAEWFRVTNGHFLLGTTTDDGIGDLLQVAGTSRFSGAARGIFTAPTISTATFTPVIAASNGYRINLSSACPCTLANPSGTLIAMQEGMFEVAQDGTGSRTIGTYGSVYVTAGGTSSITLSTAASTVDYIPYHVDSTASFVVLGGVIKGPTH